MKQVNKILQTKDYSIFKRINGNRNVDKNHVKNIRESMKEQDLMIPIIINSEFEVIDGQHRLQARNDLGLPVYYVIVDGLGIRETQRVNINNKNWTANDFLNTYCELNYYHYKVYADFKKRFRFGHQETVMLLSGVSGGGEQVKEFSNGDFTVSNLEYATDVAEKIYQIEPFYLGFKRRSFIFAFCRALKNESFDFEEFINKLSYQSSKLVDCTNTVQYLKIIEEIYNFKRKIEDKIRLV